jgi:hypothetical protein
MIGMRRLLLVLAGVTACRTSAMERGPMLEGDERIIRETIAPALIGEPGEPPPPPIDTLSSLRVAPMGAALVAPGDTASAAPAAGIRARYYLREDGKRGWIAFPQSIQPAGVTVDSAARIIIRDGRMGGAGTITVRDARGTLVIDLGKHLRGAGSEIRGSCGARRPGRGACATLVFEGVAFTPASGAPRTERLELEIGR